METKIVKVQSEIGYQIARRNELSQWNVNNAIIKAKMDIRLHEKLIASAQKQKLMPDVLMEEEVEAM